MSESSFTAVSTVSPKVLTKASGETAESAWRSGLKWKSPHVLDRVSQVEPSAGEAEARCPVCAIPHITNTTATSKQQRRGIERESDTGLDIEVAPPTAPIARIDLDPCAPQEIVVIDRLKCVFIV
jgi:hypothetical protein